MSIVRDLTRLEALECVAQINKLRYDVFHRNDGYGVHCDATDPVTVADAVVDGYGTSSSALINACVTAFVAHQASVTDPVTSVGAHLNADTVNVITAPTATDVASAITRSDDFKVQFNAHVTNTNFHLFADSVSNVSLSNNATEAQLVDVVNQCKFMLNQHFAKAFGSSAIVLISP